MTADPTVLEDFRRYRATGDRALRNALIERHEHLAVHCARRFLGRGELYDDLLQAARLGLLKAVERYQPELGNTFATFAMPTILGELKRHFRDATWAIRVPRSVKDRYVEVKTAASSLSQALGRSPSTAELAAHLRITMDEVLEAMNAGTNYRPVPLVPPVDSDSGCGDDTQDGVTLGMGDAALEMIESRVTLEGLVAHLSDRDRVILELRYMRGLTQSEIAVEIGLSQVQVSRLLRRMQASCAIAAAGSNAASSTPLAG